MHHAPATNEYQGAYQHLSKMSVNLLNIAG